MLAPRFSSRRLEKCTTNRHYAINIDISVKSFSLFSSFSLELFPTLDSIKKEKKEILVSYGCVDAQDSSTSKAGQ